MSITWDTFSPQERENGGIPAPRSAFPGRGFGRPRTRGRPAEVLEKHRVQESHYEPPAFVSTENEEVEVRTGC